MVGLLLDLAKSLCFLLVQPAGLNPQVIDDKQLPSRLHHPRIQEITTEVQMWPPRELCVRLLKDAGIK